MPTNEANTESTNAEREATKGHRLLGRLVGASGVMLAASLLGNGLGYLFQVLMARLLGPNDYGTLQTLLAAFMVVGVPLTTAAMLVSRRVTELEVEAGPAAVPAYLGGLLGTALLLSLGALLLTLPLASFIAGLLSVTPTWLVVILAASLVGALLQQLGLAVAQGQKQFMRLAAAMVASGVLKLLLCVLAALLGAGVGGVMGGLTASGLLTFLWVLLPLFRSREMHLRFGAQEARAFRLVHLGNAAPVLMANLGFAVLTQMDVVFVNRILGSTEAGRYAAAAMLAKLLIYMPVALILPMFSFATEARARGHDSRKLLLKASAGTLLIAGGGALIFILAPEQLIGLLFGQTFLPSADWLPRVTMALTPFALVYVLINYLTAVKRTSYMHLVTAVAALAAAVTFLAASDVEGMLRILGSSGLGLAAIGLGLALRRN